MHHDINKFILRTLLALMPCFALVALYVITDPFKVVHPYTGTRHTTDTVTLTVNNGYLSTRNFLRFKDTMHYDSFIFGSSLSKYFTVRAWSRHLPAGASVYHFDQNGETLCGIYNKINFVNKNGIRIKHALIIIEEEMLRRDENTIKGNFLYVQDYKTTPQFDWLEFHTLFFNMFKSPEFIKYALDPNDNVGRMLALKYATTDIPSRIEATNEEYYPVIDSIMLHAPAKFFTAARLAKRNVNANLTPYNYSIDTHTRSILEKIQQALAKNHTDYIVIVPPRYYRRTLSGCDFHTLGEIFGSNNVFDFSHDKTIYQNPRNYYDAAAHLIPRKCAELLDSAYFLKIHSIASPYF